jgi:hypothetical protein
MMTRIDSLVVETTVKPTATPRLRRPAVPAPATSAFMPAEAIGAHWLVPAFLAIGIIFRLVAYFAHRSLWLDEAMLVHNLIHRSWTELLQTLDFNQAAPVGFLWVEKLVVVCMGTSELALRLWPLLAGIISLFLFLRVARNLLQPKAVPLGLALFAAAPSLVYYASEVKQYSSDVFWTLACIAAACSSAPEKWSGRAMVGWSLLGAVAVWFSFPVVFVLAGLGAVWFVDRAVRRDWIALGRLGMVGLVWLLSFGSYYVLLLRHLVLSEYLLDYWQASFMPLLPHTQADLGWFLDTFFHVLTYPVGLSFNQVSLTGIGALVLIFGCVALWTGARRPLFLLLAPVGFTLLASGLHRYPFGGRLLLFLVPSVLLLLAAGAEHIRSRTAAALPLLGAAVIGLLLFGPVVTSARTLVQPRAVEEARPVLEHVKERWRADDCLYLYYRAWPAFLYYAPRVDFPRGDYRVGTDSRDDWSKYRPDLRQLRGRKRVWILLTHIHSEERQYLLTCLDEMGARLETYATPGAAVYLYDLSARSPER